MMSGMPTWINFTHLRDMEFMKLKVLSKHGFAQLSLKKLITRIILSITLRYLETPTPYVSLYKVIRSQNLMPII